MPCRLQRCATASHAAPGRAAPGQHCGCGCRTGMPASSAGCPASRRRPHLPSPVHVRTFEPALGPCEQCLDMQGATALWPHCGCLEWHEVSAVLQIWRALCPTFRRCPLDVAMLCQWFDGSLPFVQGGHADPAASGLATPEGGEGAGAHSEPPEQAAEAHGGRGKAPEQAAASGQQPSNGEDGVGFQMPRELTWTSVRDTAAQVEALGRTVDADLKRAVSELMRSLGRTVAATQEATDCLKQSREGAASETPLLLADALAEAGAQLQVASAGIDVSMRAMHAARQCAHAWGAEMAKLTEPLRACLGKRASKGLLAPAAEVARRMEACLAGARALTRAAAEARADVRAHITRERAMLAALLAPLALLQEIVRTRIVGIQQPLCS